MTLVERVLTQIQTGRPDRNSSKCSHDGREEGSDGCGKGKKFPNHLDIFSLFILLLNINGRLIYLKKNIKFNHQLSMEQFKFLI